MPLFRKRPLLVEAEQFNDAPYPKGVMVEYIPETNNYLYYVVTIHGQRAYLAAGDWVIKEADGVHYYPCKNEIFQATYEPV